MYVCFVFLFYHILNKSRQTQTLHAHIFVSFIKSFRRKRESISKLYIHVEIDSLLFARKLRRNEKSELINCDDKTCFVGESSLFVWIALLQCKLLLLNLPHAQLCRSTWPIVALVRPEAIFHWNRRS